MKLLAFKRTKLRLFIGQLAQGKMKNITHLKERERESVKKLNTDKYAVNVKDCLLPFRRNLPSWHESETALNSSRVLLLFQR